MDYTLKNLCEDIRLAGPVTDEVLSLAEGLNWEALEDGCRKMATPGQWEEGLTALRTALSPDEKGLKLLTCCLRQALSTRTVFLGLGLSQEIFVETMACFSRFVGEHMVSFGCYGFDRAFWTVRQLSGLLFRIGELEYELVNRDGENQIHLHIPSGSDLRDAALDASLAEARDVLHRCFPEYDGAPMLCDSWMLSPTLRFLLPADSRILRFQDRFRLTPQGQGNSFMEWVFKRTDLPLDVLPEDTGLQRRLKAHLLAGGGWTEAVGVLKILTVMEDKTYDQERALYGSRGLALRNCAFDGPADGESALKECRDIRVENTYCNLRYPFWHDRGLTVRDSELTPLCRAALWYSDRVELIGTKLHGIKALRECSNVKMEDCHVLSAEFGWSVRGLQMGRSTVESEYFLMRGEDLHLSEVTFKGKYSFQYVKDVTVENSMLDTKDAFWHSHNVTVKNCTLKGEYLAWYSDGLTLIGCTIIGTQPFCYCTNLRLIDCQMVDTDLAFEKSQVEATVTTPVLSIKNPLSGTITVPAVGEIIMDDENAKGRVLIG